ncbi:MAG: ABC transporter permease [Geodermatophilaceae bacterium]
MSASTEPAAGATAGAVSRRSAVRARILRTVGTPSALIGCGLMAVVLVASLLADTIAPGDPFASSGPGLLPPSADYLMGTDNFGRDIAGAIVHGLRTSMTIVFWVVLISLVIGLTVGILSGYRGGWLDDVLSRLTEVFQAIPLFFLALLVVGFFGSGIDNLILLLGFTSWELLARVVRAETLSLRKLEFVEAARSSGASATRIMLGHILPNVLPAAAVVMALVGSRVILIEAALSFIGLGDPNEVSLGYLIFGAQPFLRVAWWMSVFPGLAIVIAVLAINLTGDLVADLLDPRRNAASARTRRRRRGPGVVDAGPERPTAEGSTTDAAVLESDRGR